MKKLIVTLFFSFLINAVTVAQTESEYASENMYLQGRYSRGVSNSVAAIPGYMFGNDGAVFQIYIYNDDELSKIGEVTAHGPITDIFVSAELNMAFVTTANFGLEIIDISNRAGPEITGYVKFDATSEAVYVYEDYADGAKAFVLTSYDGLYSVDVSDPTNPTVISNFATYGQGEDLFGDGNNFKLYVADGNSGFEIIDIANPNQMQRLGRKDTDGIAKGIFVYDNTAYVADYYKIRLYDVGNPAAISYITYFTTAGHAYDIVVSDTLAIVADGDNGVEFIDLTEQQYPYYAETEGAALSVFYCSVNNKVYAAANQGGLYEIKAENGEIVSNFKAGGNAIGLAFDESKLHVADGFGGYVLLDISDVSAPEMLDKFETQIPAYSKGVAVAGDYAFLAAGTSGIIILDVSNTNEVTAIDTITLSSGVAYKVFINDNKAYVACGQGGVRILDITNPASPQILGGFTTAYSAMDVLVEGDYAYVADFLDGMEIWNVSDPNNAVGIATTNQPVNGVGIFKKDNYVFLSGVTSGVRIVDCSDFDNVHEVAYIRPNNYGETYAAFVNDEFIYTADGSKGVHVIDYHNFDSLKVVGYFQTGGRARDIYVDNSEEKNIYVADEDDGIYILRYEKTDDVENSENEILASFELKQNYPNPFNPTTTISYSIPSVIARSTAMAGTQSVVNVALTVYNALGQKIATLVNKKQAAGNYTVRFDARDLPSGIYFYTLRAGDFVATKKMILMK